MSKCKRVVDSANSIRDVMIDFTPFSVFERNGIRAQITNVYATGLSNKLQTQIVGLFEMNMKLMYLESDWGYDPVAKRNELFDDDARYLLATSNQNGLLGFVHFRFVEDDGVPLMYIYEIQIANVVQHKGLGKFLMQLLLLVARRHGMKLVALTVFKSNLRALDFYKRKLGFEIDETSPSACGDHTQSYEVLSKVVDPTYR